jgi:hypothetical protein
MDYHINIVVDVDILTRSTEIKIKNKKNFIHINTS